MPAQDVELDIADRHAILERQAAIDRGQQRAPLGLHPDEGEGEARAIVNQEGIARVGELEYRKVPLGVAMDARARWMSDSAVGSAEIVDASRFPECFRHAGRASLRAGRCPGNEWPTVPKRAVVRSGVLPAGLQHERRVDAIEKCLARRVIARHRGDQSDEPVRIRHGARPQRIDHVDFRVRDSPQKLRLCRRQELRKRVQDRAFMIRVRRARWKARPARSVRSTARSARKTVRRVRACDARAGERCAMPPQVAAIAIMRAACGVPVPAPGGRPDRPRETGASRAGA
mgnify:CR=1 FL=1